MATIGGWGIDIGALLLRISVLGSLMYIVSYLSRALMGQNAELERQAQRQKRMSNVLMHVQKLARLGSWTYEPGSGRFIWSEELRDIYGAPPDEEGIAFFMRSAHPEDRHQLEEALATATRNRTGFSLEHRIMRADGSIRYVHAQGKFEEDVSPPTVLGTALDITERRRAEEYDAKLRELEASRSQALQINDDIVQGITVAKYALEMGRLDIAAEAMESTLAGAKGIVRDLLSDDAGELGNGGLLRTEPAILHRRSDPDEGDPAASASTA
jgi:PAS domain S-box-containing protein